MEDQPDVADLLEDMLSIDRYQVNIFHSSTGALDVIQAEKPDVVLLDIMMPDVSGLEVLRFLRREPGLQQTPVVFVSAKTLPADIQTGLEAGATAYLTKPVDVELLRRTEARAIRGEDPKTDDEKEGKLDNIERSGSFRDVVQCACSRFLCTIPFPQARGSDNKTAL